MGACYHKSFKELDLFMYPMDNPKFVNFFNLLSSSGFESESSDNQLLRVRNLISDPNQLKSEEFEAALLAINLGYTNIAKLLLRLDYISLGLNQLQLSASQYNCAYSKASEKNDELLMETLESIYQGLYKKNTPLNQPSYAPSPGRDSRGTIIQSTPEKLSENPFWVCKYS